MADKIAVMFNGRLQQAGTAQEVFDNPDNVMVATFIGSPPMNILPGTLSGGGDGLTVTVLDRSFRLPPWARLREWHDLPRPVSVGIRATDIIVDAHILPAAIPGRVDLIEAMGAETFLTIDCGAQGLICRAAGRLQLRPGTEVSLTFDPHYLYAFDPETGRALIDRSGWTTPELRRDHRMETEINV